MAEPIHLLSLGAGVQSSTMALMAAAGEITPMPSAAIFADTQAEPAGVYQWLNWLEKQLAFPVHRVTAGSLTEQITTTKINQKTGENYYSNMIPAFCKNPDGTRGITGRSCTSNFKIDPILKLARQLGGIKRGQKTVGVIQWIGISLDEATRMKPSLEKWAQKRWPLIDLRMNRHDCLRWMKAKGFPVPPRSACVYCPFHSDAEWRRLRDQDPEGFAEAIRVEKAVNDAQQSVTRDKNRMRSKAYLHDSIVPLDQVDFSTDEDHGQQIMFQNECEGMCGI